MLTKEARQHWFYFFTVGLIVVVLGLRFLPNNPPTTSTISLDFANPTPIPSPSPEPTPFTKYLRPILQPKDAYRIFFVGDSMTVALGPHPSRFSYKMNDAFPGTGFIIDNYGVGSVNIFSLETLLTQEVNLDGKVEPAALNRDMDILIIESFANNPMSDLPLEVGLQKQRETLDLAVGRIMREKPNTVIILLATVAPSDLYGLGSINIPTSLRKDYARERRAYLENFIKYAIEKDFPLVNAYEATKQPSGDAKPGFISDDGHIHPSQQGVDFIQDYVAEFIIKEGIIPSKKDE